MILVFNLWRSIFSPRPSADAFMHIESGTVQVKTWNTDEYFDLNSDAVIIGGDEIKTSADAKVVVEFYDGTIMRMGGGADVLFEEIDENGGDEAINLLLINGKIWFNKLYRDTGDTGIVVAMDNIVVKSTSGNIFELENEFDEVVRVLNGDDLAVDVKSMEDNKIIETEKVGVGQEIVFTDKVLERYWQYQSPTVLTALTDEFKQSEWYLWNIEEDKNPTQFVKGIVQNNNGLVEVAPEVKEEAVDDEIVEPELVDEEKEVDEEVTDDEKVDEDPADESKDDADKELGPLKTPTITSVQGVTEKNADGFYVVKGRLATLTGTVSGAEKVVVNNYTLSKFQPGDTTWSYYANADFALMVEGENVYEVYALGPNGERSESIFVKVLHAPDKAPAVVEAPQEVAPETEGNADSEVAPQF